jgi:hypothetical protein
LIWEQTTIHASCTKAGYVDSVGGEVSTMLDRRTAATALSSTLAVLMLLPCDMAVAKGGGHGGGRRGGGGRNGNFNSVGGPGPQFASGRASGTNFNSINGPGPTAAPPGSHKVGRGMGRGRGGGGYYNPYYNNSNMTASANSGWGNGPGWGNGGGGGSGGSAHSTGFVGSSPNMEIQNYSWPSSTAAASSITAMHPPTVSMPSARPALPPSSSTHDTVDDLLRDTSR